MAVVYTSMMRRWRHLQCFDIIFTMKSKKLSIHSLLYYFVGIAMHFDKL